MIGERFGPTWYGQKGTLTHVGNKVECHICGKLFHNLGLHVVKTHELSADDYRDEFGLMAKTGLLSRDLYQKRLQNARFSDPDFLARALEKNTYIKRTDKTRKPRSLQETIQSTDRQKKFQEAGTAAVRARVAAGTWIPPKPSIEALRKNIRVAIARRAELLADPIERERLKRIAIAARLVMKDTACVQCGTTFQQPSGKQRRTCSDSCRKERQRTLHAAMMQRGDVRNKMKISAKRRAETSPKDAHGRWTAAGSRQTPPAKQRNTA